MVKSAILVYVFLFTNQNELNMTVIFTCHIVFVYAYLQTTTGLSLSLVSN